MQLEAYISDLLYRYECVTIPEFGAFLTQRVSAHVDETTDTFYPPKKSVSFNEQIQKNDGLLAHYIADVEKIPFEIANKKIAKRVKLLKSYLIQGETLTFNNIGDIVFNSEGKILFEPTYHLNYLTDAFGLSQFVSPTVNREAYKKDVEAIEKVIPIAVTPEKRKSKVYLKYAAVALIALTIGGFAASNYYVNQIEQHNQLAQEQAIQQLDNKIQQATFVIENPLPAVTFNVTKQTGKYHVVAGAFRVAENSDKKVKQLNELGYKARIIGVNKYGLHEVVYSSYEDRLEALKALRTIKKEHNKDAWLKVDSETKTTKVSNEQSYNNTNLQGQKLKQTQGLSENKGSNVVNSTSESTNTIDFGKSPNIIKIIKNVSTVESGFYLILDAFEDIEKRDAFLAEVKSAGITDVGFFFDSKSEKFLIYQEKYDDLETAKKALQSNINSSYSGKMAIVKVEN